LYIIGSSGKIGTEMNRVLSTVFILLGVLILQLAGNAHSASLNFEYLFSFGRFGIGREQYDTPVDMVEDEDDDLYILDRENYRVQKVDFKGDFITEWGRRGFRDGEFKAPRSIDIDRDGTIYVVDTGNHRIQKFSPDGEFIDSFGTVGSSTGNFREPTDITFDKEQNIYIADSGNNRIQKFDKNFQFIQEWGRFERRGNDLNSPYSVAYSNDGFGHVYVADGTDCRIQKFDTRGNLKKEWSLHKPGKGYLCGPVKIKVEPRRYDLYVADIENDLILIFDKSGELIGELNEARKKFIKPAGLFVNDSVELFVVDTGNNTIHKFRR
jgi:DNA-binding beta-propeller fold protein YncE